MEQLVQRDWVIEMEEAGKVSSMEMQHYVRKMGTKLEYNAVEVAGKHRYYIFPRASVLKYLQENCNKV